MPSSLLGWAVLIIIVVLIARNPAGAGHTVGGGVDDVVTFIENL